jgi:hypothetical protein
MAISEDLVYALDRVAWSRDVLGFDPTPDQALMLQSAAHSQIVCCHRQFGKTTVTAVRAAHELLYVVDPFVVILSGGKRQADEAAAGVERFLALFPRKVAAIVKRDDLGWHLANGGRVLTLPSSEASVRGFSGVTLLIFDEAAKIDEDVVRAASPLVSARDGTQWVLSTPAGVEGWFADHWRRREELRYDSVFAAWAEGRSRVSRRYVEDETRKFGLWWARQEFGCEFLDRDDGLISRADLVSARRDVEVLVL